MPPIDFTRRTALYRLFDESGTLLYVGIAFEPEERWRFHDGAAHWWPQVARKKVEWLDTRLLALEAESAAILAEGPLYNVRGSMVPSQPASMLKTRHAPNRFVRIDDETWAEYGLACAALGISRSDDIRMRAKERVAEWKREQRREARDAAATVAREA